MADIQRRGKSVGGPSSLTTGSPLESILFVFLVGTSVRSNSPSSQSVGITKSSASHSRLFQHLSLHWRDLPSKVELVQCE